MWTCNWDLIQKFWAKRHTYTPVFTFYFWSFLFNFIWWLHSTATHLSYNTHMLQVITVLITVLFQLVIFLCHWKILKEVQKHNHKYHTSFQLGCVTKILLFHGMLTVVGGLPCKQDGDARLKFWKEPLRDTKRPFCGHGLKCFHRYEEPIHYAVSLVIFFFISIPWKGSCCGSFEAKHPTGTKTTFLPPEILSFFWPSSLLKFPIQQTSVTWWATPSFIFGSPYPHRVGGGGLAVHVCTHCIILPCLYGRTRKFLFLYMDRVFLLIL